MKKKIISIMLTAIAITVLLAFFSFTLGKKDTHTTWDCPKYTLDCYGGSTSTEFNHYLWWPVGQTWVVGDSIANSDPFKFEWSGGGAVQMYYGNPATRPRILIAAFIYWLTVGSMVSVAINWLFSILKRSLK